MSTLSARLRRLIASSALVFAIPVAAGPQDPSALSGQVSVFVDFARPIASTTAAHVGTGITGYGDGSYIVNNADHRGALDRLGVGTARIELRYRQPGDGTSGILCGGTNCATQFSGQQWTDAIRQLGAEPTVVLPLDGRHDDSIDTTDAVNLYLHFAADGRPIRRFVVGNEPDASGNPRSVEATEYSRRFNAIADALHRLDAGVKVGGPGLSYYRTAYVDTFLANSGGRVDFVDFHRYAQGGSVVKDDGMLLGTDARAYGDQITDLRRRIDTAVPARASQIGIQIGEFNLDWDGTDPRMTNHFHAVWMATVLGSILAAGGTAIQYGDKSGQLSLTSSGIGGTPSNTPLPAYHGIGMFTGEGIFRSFGSTVVHATASHPTVAVCASDGDKNVVLVNTTQDWVDVDVRYGGVLSGTAQSWLSVAGASTPAPVGTSMIAGGRSAASLPPRSITTLVVTQAISS